ncbi:Uncharacterized protein YmfQ in lambdoid prophage, DUF2313 family [Noviherbaspirillum humi]|uniref:Uncharacterized protein YmfQ in lambdoid prophage, DUF2313 family n=1 Tax=Noviherbaspirillum humi TaxID=1688639 RepID=A0A239LFJ3_9BURK|nr:putative phage tail protein [Noviherbaspirillum humi]SNT29105.1 Uncharacterized protein YmfQ in lambdoid prophage, DUF2313 family [Noviherbaspirillum humi]
MAVSAIDYLRQLQALLPHGAVWPRNDDAALTRLLQAAADELARIDARSEQLVSEADPRTTAELLADWERNAGLPDPALVVAGLSQSVAQRRTALVTRLTTVGGQSPAYFIALAGALGYTVTITDFKPFQAGVSRCGARLTNGAWRHAWQVNGALNTVTPFRAGQSAAGDPLNAWGNQLLEAVLSRFKPAHTTVLFAYS